MRIRVLTFGFVGLYSLGTVLAQHTSHDADAIIALELKLTDLLERGAWDEYARHLTPDYALTTFQGQLLTRDQALGWWRAQGPGTTMTPSEMRVRIYGNTAILTARVANSKEGAARITKTFVRIDGKWLLAALHVSLIAEVPGK